MSLISNISWRSLALWKRNRDVFLTTWKTNFLPPFLEPILYLVAMGLGFGALIQADIEYGGKSLEYIKFLAPGLVAISIMYGAFFECTYSSFVRMYYQKTFDAILATPLSLEDIITGEILWGATKSFINATIVLGVIAAFDAIILAAMRLNGFTREQFLRIHPGGATGEALRAGKVT